MTKIKSVKKEIKLLSIFLTFCGVGICILASQTQVRASAGSYSCGVCLFVLVLEQIFSANIQLPPKVQNISFLVD